MYKPAIKIILVSNRDVGRQNVYYVRKRANKMENARNKAAIVYGPNWTWHDYGRLPLNERSIIDHVFISNQLKATRYRVIGDKPDKVYLSDHNAVFVNLEYTK